MIKIFCIFLIYLLGNQALVADTLCHPTLWANSDFSQHEEMLDLQKKAKKLLSEPSHAIPILGSAGKIEINNPNLILSRLAFKDADNAAILALAFTFNHHQAYFKKTRDLLLSWASINQPTGNPINETRLEGMIWAYDLIACQLSIKDKIIIDRWLNNLRNKKLAWKFGPRTEINNHRIHQMKMILLLDKVLHHANDWQHDLAQTEKYASINLNVKTGESIDYIERDALYYHNYDLQAWLEISLISGCCREPVKSAFHFLTDHILSHDIHGEFLQSSAKIDALRSQGGFAYARTGGTFDVSKAAPTIVTYYSIMHEQPSSELWSIVQSAKPNPWLTFVKNRRAVWLNHIYD